MRKFNLNDKVDLKKSKDDPLWWGYIILKFIGKTKVEVAEGSASYGNSIVSLSKLRHKKEICDNCGKVGNVGYFDFETPKVQIYTICHDCLKKNPVLETILRTLTQKYFRKDYRHEKWNIKGEERYTLQNHL